MDVANHVVSDEEQQALAVKCMRKNSEIPTDYDVSNYKRGDVLTCRVSHIYDPSKFYIVTKHLEMEVFHTHIFKFYYLNCSSYKVPRDKLKLDMYCVVNTDSSFFRGLIVGFPLLYDGAQYAQVFYIDSGSVGIADLDKIYYMAEEFLQVPQLCIRSTMALICPVGGQLWSHVDVTFFNQAVINKIMSVRVLFVVPQLKLLGVQLQEWTLKIPRAPPVHKILFREKRAKFVWDPVVEKYEETTGYKPSSKYPWMFPSHSVLEKGQLVQSKQDEQYLKAIQPMLGYKEPYFVAQTEPSESSQREESDT